MATPNGVSMGNISPLPMSSDTYLTSPTELTNEAKKSLQQSTQNTNKDNLNKFADDTINNLEGLYTRESDSNEIVNNKPFKQYDNVSGYYSLNFGSELDFILPQYGVADFINERALWQKGVHNITGEPGWFYFKLFFNFKDQKGLFGGVMNDEIPTTSALRYLYGIRNFYKLSKIEDRILALARFVYTLSYINSISPWFFMGINNANKLNELNLNELTKEKSIDIVCNGDSIDMRLNTLLDMYRYACYDEINQKEIIPENLRKFDMSIVIMNAPIKYFQTAMMASANYHKIGQVGHNGDTLLNKAISGLNKIAGMAAGSSVTSFDFKNINGNNNGINNMLTFQMYSLKNCEIDPISFENYTPSSLSNAQFNKQGTGFIKIKYDRCYKHTFNEWTQMLYGTTGILYDMNAAELKKSHQNLLNLGISDTKYNSAINADDKNNISVMNSINNSQRVDTIRKSIYNSFFDKDADAYKGLIDFSELVIQDSLINVKDPEYLGNIAENYDETNWEDRWLKTRNKITNFFSKPLDIF